MENVQTPAISVVVPVRNGEKTLLRCLNALRNQTLSPQDLEIVVVDDGSVDGTAAMASGRGIRLISQPALGASAARNRGVAHARSEVILFTDADCLPDPSWAERLSRPLLKRTAAGAVGRCYSNQDHWVAALIEEELQERYAKMGHSRQIDFLNTGNCGFRREILGKNPFDEGFRWLEDVELSFRLAQNGHRMRFIPDALVCHPHPENLWAYLVRKFRYASYAPSIYRRYPSKTISDSRTPLNRRMQLIFLVSAGLSAAGTGFSTWFSLLGAASLLSSIICSLSVARRAFARSPWLGLQAPAFVLLGNLAFILGTVRGLIRTATRKQ
ncbi:MAG: glycosyltransferase [Acidobacteriota bacterium]